MYQTSSKINASLAYTSNVKHLNQFTILTRGDDYFWALLEHFWRVCIFEVAGAILDIGLILKPNHHNQIKLVQICETLGKNNNNNNFYSISR